MRPLRFLLLLFFFVALPVALTFWSLLAASVNAVDSFQPGLDTKSGRLRAFFSFSTPSSLFPPSAVISLTNDNSTFFLARPAAFGPNLPSKGLSGRLWVGKGFGDDALLKEENIQVAGWELGCSDVPGWAEEKAKSIKNLPAVDQSQARTKIPRSIDKDGSFRDDSGPLSDETFLQDDGTDDYLHRPLPDSNPATPGEPGEPANADLSDKKQATHADIESLQESADITGKIVMLSRGGCGFLEKVKWAQRRGGIALIVGDNEKGAQLTIMYAKGDTSNITIPALFTSYTSAHLLSSLVPQEDGDDEDANSKAHDKATTGNSGADQKQHDNQPIFTSTKPGVTKPTSLAAATSDEERDESWMKNVLSVMGLGDNSPFSHSEDSRRPPSSGNIDWVLLEDWKEEAGPGLKDSKNTLTNAATMATSALKAKSTSTKRTGADDFVIGVQDWRDTDLVAPKPTTTSQNAPEEAGKGLPTDTASSAKASSSPDSTLKGGSITPGSGEYDHEKSEHLNRFQRGNVPSDRGHRSSDNHQGQEKGSWFHVFRSGQGANGIPEGSVPLDEHENQGKERSSKTTGSDDEPDRPGLWVTLTPTSVSASPFVDTLLVLVVSPLVTLTVVYALLLLRSRIRRRRWRAPKSLVDRLPVRTYHTMSTTSSTTTSRVESPDNASATSPLLISASQNVSQRPRPRSQTTTGIFSGGSVESQLSHSRSPHTEKLTSKPAKRKRYTGRQVECVVCLEEYVDGESQVMSLPCGHEFHVDCITPWLITRRRTCPICKGDVVRSMARQGLQRYDEDDEEEDDISGDNFGVGRRQGEGTSDDIQTRVAQTVNREPSAAIPIPSLNRDNEDVERGQDPDVPLLGGAESLSSETTITPQRLRQDHARGPERRGDREGQSMWRNMVSASVGRLSGDTLWRQTPVDRSR
ncbi:PA domain-containing protein [Fonsecaea pedrosoi]|nr:PA domain-containing protein [Fonsecaea pedrosoi]